MCTFGYLYVRIYLIEIPQGIEVSATLPLSILIITLIIKYKQVLTYSLTIKNNCFHISAIYLVKWHKILEYFYGCRDPPIWSFAESGNLVRKYCTHRTIIDSKLCSPVLLQGSPWADVPICEDLHSNVYHAVSWPRPVKASQSLKTTFWLQWWRCFRSSLSGLLRNLL